jgi:L,D-transpeptidase catalytic domain
VAAVVLAALALAATAQARNGGLQWWHGTLVQNLQSSPPFTVTANVFHPAASGVGIGAPAPHTGTTTLSDERTFTQWANPAYRGPIYSRPDGSAPRVGRLHMLTEDGFPEVYVLLQEALSKQGRPWVRLRIPARPNGQTGWVRRSALGPFEVSYWLLVVNRRTEQLTAYWQGKRRFQGPVGVGKPSTPTPPGHFWIRERFRVLDPSSAYWPDAMGTSDYSILSEWPGGGVVGIHGAWGKPWLIPGRPSHGCIRMHNPDIAWLAPRVPVGTPLHVI